MRPKRPVRPPAPPPPIPAVVTPEDLDAINPPAVDEIPAYISVGKFQWKPPVPGPKGDQGDTGAPGTPGEPGATVRPITPPVTNAEIAASAVTPGKLDVTTPATDGQLYSYDVSGKFKPVDPPAGGDAITILPVPIQVFSHYGHEISFTADVALAPAGVPANAKAVIVESWGHTDVTTANMTRFYFCEGTGGSGAKLNRQVLNKGLEAGEVDRQYVFPLSTPQTLFVEMQGWETTDVTWEIRVVGYIV